jgi:hypothetical protein
MGIREEEERHGEENGWVREMGKKMGTTAVKKVICG